MSQRSVISQLHRPLHEVNGSSVSITMLNVVVWRRHNALSALFGFSSLIFSSADEKMSGENGLAPSLLCACDEQVTSQKNVLTPSFYSLRVVTEVSPSVSGVAGDLEILQSPT